MSTKTKITVHPNFKIGEISDLFFSAFLEPIGTMVNGTMYNPKHPTADEQGFRTDFINALKDTKLPGVRLPGGNFVSAWQWKDSIGPKSERKVHLDPAWYQYITNDVGHDEYLQWAEKVGTTPLYTVNMGTGSMQDAMDIVEYTNHEGGTYWSDLRRKNGHEAPYKVKTWYLGNEMDGPWQLGSWNNNPTGYGVKCLETAKAMKWIDPTIKTGVCGSSAPFMEHFPEWDEKVLDECYDVVDYLSVHHYHSAPMGDFKALLGGALYYEDFINNITAMFDFVAAKHRNPKKMKISFDEYGTMTRDNAPLNPGYGRFNMARTHYRFNPERQYILHDPDNMQHREFPGGDMVKLLSMTSVQLALLRHADRVEITCMTGGLGALCASNHDNVWKEASHYAFMDLINYAKGTSMQVSVEGDTFDIPGYAIDDTSQYIGKDNVNYVDCACAWNEKENELTLFVINKSETEEYPLSIDISGFKGYDKLSATQIYTNDLDAKNTFEEQKIVPSINESASCNEGFVTADIKPLSWNVFKITK